MKNLAGSSQHACKVHMHFTYISLYELFKFYGNFLDPAENTKEEPL